MHFHLRGWLRLSKPPTSTDLKLIEEALVEKVPPLLSRGVPGGKKGSKVVSWAIDGDKLVLEIEGSRYLRPHDALLRVKNLLARELGRRRIGIREAYAEEYKVRADISAEEEKLKELVGDYARVEATEPLVIAFRELSEEELKSRVVDRALAGIERLVEEKPKGAEMVPMGTVLVLGPRKGHATVDGKPIDPNAEGVRRGWFKRFAGRGQWTLTAPSARLLRVLKEMVEEHVLIPMGFQEWMFPKLMPWSIYEKMPGYFEHLAQGLMYAGHVGRDPSALKEFKLKVRLKREADPELVKREMRGPTHVLAAAQCEPFYQFFGGEVTPEEELPIRAYDASGWTYRWEGGGVEGIVRTVEFFRLESVWMGTPEQATDIRWEIAERTMEFVDKRLDLEAKMVVGAPFYLSPEQASEQLVDVSGEKYPNVPTIDLEAYVAYKGPREKAEWLELNGITIHKLKYVESFGIKSTADVWTGCNGYGLTRYLAAFLARHGFEPGDWPVEVRERFESRGEPRTPRLVTWP